MRLELMNWNCATVGALKSLRRRTVARIKTYFCIFFSIASICPLDSNMSENAAAIL